MIDAEKLKERMREMDPAYKVDKFSNRLSTGGVVERRFKKRVGNKINKNLDNKMDKTNNLSIVDKIQKRIRAVENPSG